ncbi:MAG: spore coat protein [Flammeovirgaceae bacterium]|nr:spore coat protein [Flammeovirgaceae bacterium]
MKGVILAGGTGSRLYPLTAVTNKHLLPVGRKPMILHSVSKLQESGVEDIMIITGTEHMGDMINLLGSGKDFGVNFTFKVQDQPSGVAGALALAENFTAESKFIVILGDNIFTSSLHSHIRKYNQLDVGGCMLFLRAVDDPHRYGVATLDDNNNLIRITEKPEVPDTNLCITGIYIYDKTVFDIIKQIQPSDRGELEITEVNNEYIRRKSANFCLLEGMWTDAGTWTSYKLANDFFYNISEK